MKTQEIADFYTWFSAHEKNTGNSHLFRNKEGMKMAYLAGCDSRLLRIYQMICDFPEYPINADQKDMEIIIKDLHKRTTEIYDYMNDEFILNMVNGK